MLTQEPAWGFGQDTDILRAPQGSWGLRLTAHPKDRKQGWNVADSLGVWLCVVCSRRIM